MAGAYRQKAWPDITGFIPAGFPLTPMGYYNRKQFK
jgi:hypothetical protein